MSIIINQVSKAYKQYKNQFLRLLEWISPIHLKYHNDKYILNDINICIGSGESVGIIGVNGAGKSTLLKMITGTTKPTSGNITIDGRVAALLELGMGFDGNFTGRQNVYMSGQLQGLNISDIDELMLDIENFAEIGEYIDLPLRTYSSGMQARLGFAVATALKPDILIVDEALSVGDVKFQAKCYARINEYKKQGMTLLLVSHAVMDMVRHCDRAIFLHNGRVKADGNSKDVTNIYLDTIYSSRTEKSKENNSELIDNRKGLENSELIKVENCPGYNKNEYRWGNGGAKIESLYWESNGVPFETLIRSGDNVKIIFSAYFEKDFEYITPGLLIKTLDGLFVSGTNSFFATKKKTILSGKHGKTNLFQFEFDINLNKGTYLLSIGLSDGDPFMETQPVDRRYDVIHFDVVSDDDLWGLVNLNPQFSVVE